LQKKTTKACQFDMPLLLHTHMKKSSIFKLITSLPLLYNTIRTCMLILHGGYLMNNTTINENYYTIGHIVQFTGLTDRTIRNYISSGILQGEKINGLWHFTPEQVETFIRHSTVRPSIIAKKNALIYDFLLDTRKRSDEICMILDLPNKDEKEVAEFFCYTISKGNFNNIQFSFDSLNGLPRVIVKGDGQEVLLLTNQYYEHLQ